MVEDEQKQISYFGGDGQGFVSHTCDNCCLTGDTTLSPHRSKLHPDTLEAIMCSQHWLWATSGRGGVPEEKIFTGKKLKNEDKHGPQILD